MADKAIGSLVQTTTLGLNDLLVLEQNNTAKSISGQNLINLLAAALDGHGGISSIAKTGSSGTNPKIDTYTITFADESTASFTVTNGLKGDKGDQTQVYIRYANRQPIADSDLTTTPDSWIGIYVGTAATAPTSYSAYTWYQYKGETGDTGDAAELVSSAIEYQVSSSGTEIPTGAWSASVPSVPQGMYLWTRTTLTFNSGSPVVSYSVGRIGVDGSGTGTVQSVNEVQPDNNGNVDLSATDIPTAGGSDVETDLAAKQPKKLLFSNVNISAASFVSDSTYEEYGYRAQIVLSGVTASMLPEVIFGLDDAVSGIFAPIVESFSGGIYVYASEQPSGATTVPTIVVWG